jgi:steroid 5-alpha reductase family enzyme
MDLVMTILITNLSIVMTMMIVLWIISIPLCDVSFVDIFWALGMMLVACSTYLMVDGSSDRRIILVLLTTIWGSRLGLHLYLRWRREGADRRYTALLALSPGNKHLFSLRKVFLTQGPLLWLVTLPVQLGQLDTVPTSLGPLVIMGCGLAVIGVVFETVGDWQLARFKADPDNRGAVMDRGLWRFTRHPNYFGDACFWWGLYLVAAETATGQWAIISPIFLTYTLIKWSGAPLLERHLRRSRPGYKDYMRKTSGFFPRLPRNGS